MSTLFFIGNGFDLNCGMKTKYTDAYAEYLKTNSGSDAIAKFKKEIGDNIKTWGDFEMSMAKYASGFTNEYQFLDCLYDFQAFLRDYLKREEEEFWKRAIGADLRESMVNEFQRALMDFYKKTTNNITYLMQDRGTSQIDDMNFVSFNYTRVFDKILRMTYGHVGILNKGENVCHIHGETDDLTLGIDNEMQLDVQFPVTENLKRSFIKPFFNEQYDVNRISTVKEALDEANTVCVYGMSLGLSDLTWRTALVEWLKKSEENHLFLYDFELSSRKTRATSEKMKIEEDAKKNKLNEWGVEFSAALFERFHMVCGINIFNINDEIKRVSVS